MPKGKGQDQWYSNKELYEKFTEDIGKMQDEMQRTREELRDTNDRFHHYNGLHGRFDQTDEKIDEVKGKIEKVEGRQEDQESKCNKVLAQKEGKGDLVDKLIRVFPIVVQLILAFSTIYFASRAAGL